ncbi:MAG TPA: chorismate synthase [Candidatus Dormibacteraeota bacterium]|nr:chorismate synthase [Candidatus Dormibacteraeota bacterium]
MLRFLTAGESHGPQLTVVIEGVPAGLPLSAPRDIDPDLRRRQWGYGRSKRQQLEQDRATILSGVRGGRTLGSPITLVIQNRVWEDWQKVMQVEARGFKPKRVTRLRPGHADLAGVLKYGFDDVRNVLERASARETAARVAAGAVAKALLRRAGTEVHSYVLRVGPVEAPMIPAEQIDWRAVEESPVRCPDPDAAARMVEAIDGARETGDTLGGTALVIASGVVAGLGSYVHWDRRLDGQLAQALMSIQSVKGVDLGAEVASVPGSQLHDAPEWVEGEGFRHVSNNQGGLTGGVTDGEDVWAQVHFKPIATMLKPMRSTDLATKEQVNAHYERSDVCHVPAGAVIAEAMTALVLANALEEKFGGDSMVDLTAALRAYRRRLRA